jgi:glyoxylase-like metal-dependent hydrolase (beta-lactamase superfamily II)
LTAGAKLAHIVSPALAAGFSFGSLSMKLANRVNARVIVALALGWLVVAGAQATAPMVKSQAPGYYRMMVGDFEVTALSDGTVDIGFDKLLTQTTPAETKRGLDRAFLKPTVETSVNGFLINTGDKLVLVDTGAGKLFGPTLGNLVANLKAAGYQPEQVDEIYITHMHPDHIGGLAPDGKMIFPNAIVRGDKRDGDFWLSQKTLDAAPKDEKDFIQGAMATLKPYVDAGKYKPFDGNADLVPGIRAVATYGHTPGHAIYIVESKGQKLVLWGDLMHLAAVQFANPAVTIKFDSDSKAAAVQRKKAFADAAKGGYWVGAAHLPFPGIGHLRSDGSGYAFVPANYSVPR